MPISYPALAAEITSDPRGYGYAADVAVGSDTGVKDRLNLPRAGITVQRQRVPRQDILEAIDLRDFITNPNQVGNATFASGWFESVTQSDQIRLANPDGTPTRVRQNLDRMLGNGNLSQTRLDAVAVKTPSSRAEELFGEGTVVTDTDVQKALRPNG